MPPKNSGLTFSVLIVVVVLLLLILVPLIIATQ